MRRHYSLIHLSKLAAAALLLMTTLLGALVVGGQGSFTGMTAAEASNMAFIPNIPSSLVINEIFDSATPANEYFELYNTGTTAINLSTYQIYNRDGRNNLSNLADPIIGAGQFRVIGPTQLGTPTIAGSGLARIDFLGLVNTSPTDTIVDVVNFGGSPNPNWANYERFRDAFFTVNIPTLPDADGPRTLQRWPDGTDSDRGTDFAQIFSSPSAASCADPFEDDDTFQTAVAQTVGAPVMRRLCAGGDEDWISISMSTSFTYTLRTEAVGSRVDTVMRLYDSSGALIVEDDNTTRRDSTINFRPTSAATFRVQIVDKNNAGTNGTEFLYNFQVTATSSSTPTPGTPTPAGCIDAYEPDNTLETAKPIELNTDQEHVLCPAGDSDWVFFSAAPNKVYTMVTRNLARPVDTLLTLYDAEGNRLAENDDYQPGQGLESRIDYVFSHAGVYFLRARDKRGSGGLGYSYRLAVESAGALPPTGTPTRTPSPNPNTPTPTPGQCYDAFEPDGIPETAKTILIGSTQRHIICPVADADWVRFYARGGKLYTIRTANLGPGLDTYMYLFDTDGRRILAQNDDAGGAEGVASRIEFFPQRDDWYYAQIKNAGDIGSPDQTYDLSLTVATGAPQPPPTATGNPPLPSTPRPPTTVVQPTSPAQPTSPPPPTPTRGPATTPPPNAPLPSPVGTTVVGGGTEEEGELPPVPTPVPADDREPNVVLPTAVGTPMIPNVPRTGHAPEAAAPFDVNQGLPLRYAPVQFQLFSDMDGNSSYSLGEGIRGIDVFFRGGNGSLAASGASVTSREGTARLTLPLGRQRVYIPYLGINLELGQLPGRDLYSLRLPRVELPDRVP